LTVTRSALNLRTALRTATFFSIEERMIAACMDTRHKPDALFARATEMGLPR
jgi:hypothetical protein